MRTNRATPLGQRSLFPAPAYASEISEETTREVISALAEFLLEAARAQGASGGTGGGDEPEDHA
jgi:hypothetical protein